MSLIRSYVPEDEYGHPKPVSGRALVQALARFPADPPPFGVVRPKAPHLAIGMAVECIHPTLSLNTGQRLVAVPWRKVFGVLQFLIRVGPHNIYVPIHALRPLAARHDHLFPHWKRDQRRAA